MNILEKAYRRYQEQKMLRDYNECVADIVSICMGSGTLTLTETEVCIFTSIIGSKIAKFNGQINLQQQFDAHLDKYLGKDQSLGYFDPKRIQMLRAVANVVVADYFSDRFSSETAYLECVRKSIPFAMKNFQTPPSSSEE